MQRASKQKRIPKAKKRSGKRATHAYVGTQLGELNQPSTQLTFKYPTQMNANVIGTNGYSVGFGWNAFPELAQYINDYKYFEILGYQIEPTINTANLSTFYGGAVGVQLVNANISESNTFAAPTTLQQVRDIPGSVWLQLGASNEGRWIPTNIKQQFNLKFAYNNPQNAGALQFYVDNVGAAEVVGDVIVSVNLRLYGKQYP